MYLVRRLKSLPAQFDAEGIVVTLGKTVSKDGTEVPYFLVKREGTATDGDTPTLLCGYGGFEISLGPRYVSNAGIAWLERGGAYVEANIRGGESTVPVGIRPPSRPTATDRTRTSPPWRRLSSERGCADRPRWRFGAGRTTGSWWGTCTP